MAIDSQALRIFAYDRLIERGLPPTSKEIAGHFDVKQADALQALSELRIGKTILPHPETGEIWMAGPFAASVTDYEVNGRHRRWWANCAWDMLGIAALVREPVTIETHCSDCNAPVSIHVAGGRVVDEFNADEEHLVHFLVPARRWYDDIGFT